MNNQHYKKKTETIRVKVVIDWQNWLRPDGEYGIFRCRPMETDAEVKLNSKGEFNIKGDLPYDLKVGKSYVVYLRNPEYNEKFRNYTYTIDRFETEQLTLPEEQYEFLSTVATENICKQLEALYPNQPIIDLIFEDKVDFTQVNGLGEKSLENLKEKLELYKDLGKLQNMLKPLGVTIRAIKKIANHFGSPDSAYYTLQKSLYNLCQVKGFGFAKVDEIALKGGTDPQDPLRIRYCLAYILEQQANDGHSWNYREDLKVEALEYLQIEPHLVDTLLDESTYVKGEFYDSLDIIVVGELVSTFGMYYAERSTLDNLDRLLSHYIPLSDDIAAYNYEIDDVQAQLGIVYSEEQRNAIINGLQHGVYIIEGLAGTGKTTIIKAIEQIQSKRGVLTIAVALSGKAANVLSSKGLHAATMHRTLGFNGEGFAHHENSPLSYRWVNLDEAGMANATLWSALVRAIPNGAQFIISGDAGQLAAIGHGDVMRDILGSIRYPKTELKQIHRQAQDSGVIEVAHLVRHGQELTGYNHEMNNIYGANKDLQVITQFKPKKDEVVVNPFMSDEEQKEAFNPIYVTAKMILDSQIHKIKMSDDPERALLDFQVICPTKVGALGVESLNAYAQHIYNKNSEGISKGKITFKKDDKVIINGNKYGIKGYETIKDYILDKPLSQETEVEMPFGEDGETRTETKMLPIPFDLFNGTMGIIKGVFKDKQEVLVRFEGIDALISIHEDDMDALDLGYAITVHKSQGSSIPNVLFTFDFSAFKLLSKQLVYTALTRTSTGKCLMLCENNALLKALQVDASGNRRTFMRLFLEHLDAESLQSETQESESVEEWEDEYPEEDC